MRRTAVSVAHQNMTFLGCSYPTAVEEEIRKVAGDTGRGRYAIAYTTPES